MAKKVKKIRIEVIRSLIGRLPVQKKTMKALGLRKISQKVEKNATPVILGMVNRVSHLVKVEEIS